MIDVYTSDSYGNCVKYVTNDGYEIIYAHLKESLVVQNQNIKQGEVIALVGSTGLATGAHLHYIIKKDDAFIDPIDYVDFPYYED